MRDVLLDMPTKDFDIATDATPEQINRMFANSRIIGRRFCRFISCLRTR